MHVETYHKQPNGRLLSQMSSEMRLEYLNLRKVTGMGSDRAHRMVTDRMKGLDRIEQDVNLPNDFISPKRRAVLIAAWCTYSTEDELMRRVKNHSRSIWARNAVLAALVRPNSPIYGYSGMARFFGLDHTTVIHGVLRAKERAMTDKWYYRLIEKIRKDHRLVTSLSGKK